MRDSVSHKMKRGLWLCFLGRDPKGPLLFEIGILRECLDMSVQVNDWVEIGAREERRKVRCISGFE